jgi:hypothetical protein
LVSVEENLCTHDILHRHACQSFMFGDIWWRIKKWKK